MALALCRAPCCATSSRVTLATVATAAAATRRRRFVPVSRPLSSAPTARALASNLGSPRAPASDAESESVTLSSLKPLAGPVSVPFFTPGPTLAPRPGHGIGGAGRGRTDAEPDPHHHSSPPDPTSEAEVDDREWEMRVAQGMMHLRDTLPLLFTEASSKELFPNDIYSKHIVLRMPVPFPLKVSSLQAYAMVFNIARNGMQALHTDLNADLERMTFSAAPPPTSPAAAAREALLGKAPAHRQKQIRVLLNVTGHPRLPPHKEASWHASSLYTFSPYSGLISSHEVETIRPLPGEGVTDQLMKALLGWTNRQGVAEGALAGPRITDVHFENDHVVRSGEKK